jgi:TP901 family phage tail tape measure protein
MAAVELKLNMTPALDVGKMNAMLKHLKTSLGEFGKGIQLIDANKFNAEIGSVTKEFPKLQKAADNAFKSINDGAAKAGGGISSKLKGGLGEIANFAAGGLLTGGVTAVAGAITGAFSAAIDIGKQFETSLAGVSAITGQSGASLDALGNSARELAKKFGGSATEQLASFQGILSRFGPAIGNSPAALSSMADTVNVFSKAAGIDAATSMDVLTNAALQFGVDLTNPKTAAQEMAKMMNVMAAAAQEGAADIPFVGDAIVVAGSAAKLANVSFAETNAAIQVVAAKAGKYGAEAGTGIRNVIGLLQKNSEEAKKAAASIGVDFDKLGATLTKDGLSAAMKMLGTGLNGVGSAAQRNAVLMQIFGTENASVASAILNNTAEVDRLNAAISGTDSGYKQAATNMNTFEEASKRAAAKSQDLAIGFFQFVKPALAAGATAFSAIVDRISEFASKAGTAFESFYPKIQPFVSFVVDFIGQTLMATFERAGMLISGAFEIVGTAISRVLEAVKPVTDKLSQMFATAQGGTPVIEEITSVFGLLTDIVVELVKHGIEILVTAIEYSVSVFGLLFNIGSSVVSMFSDNSKEVKSAGKETEKATGFFEKLRAVLFNIRGTIAGVTSAFREIKTVISEAFTAIQDLDFSKAFDILGKGNERAQKAYDKGWNGFKETAKDGAAALEETTSNIPPPAVQEFGGKVLKDEKKKEKAERVKTAFEIAKAEIDARQKAIKANADADENEIERKRIDAGTVATLKDQFDAETRNLDVIKQQGEALREKLKIGKDAPLTVENIGIKLADDAERTAAQELINTFNAATNKAQKDLQAVRLKMTLEDDAKLKQQFEKTEKDLILNVSLGTAKKDDLAKLYQDQLAQVQSLLNTEAGVLSEERRKNLLSDETELSKKLADVKEKIYDAELAALDKKQAKERKKVEQGAKLNASIVTALSKISLFGALQGAGAEDTAELDALQKQRDNELISEEKFLAEKKRLEREAADRLETQKQIDAALALEAERTRHIAEMTLLKQQQEEKRALLVKQGRGGSEEALRIGAEIEEISAQIQEKGNLVTQATDALGIAVTDSFGGMFSGDEEAIKRPFRVMFKVLAEAISKLASAKATQWIFESVPAGTGILGAIAAFTGGKAIVENLIGGILSPLLGSLASFATGGVVNSPTLAVVGDAKLAGSRSNTEFIFQSEQLHSVVAGALQSQGATFVSEIRALGNRIAAMEFTLKGNDLVGSFTRSERTLAARDR